MAIAERQTAAYPDLAGRVAVITGASRGIGSAAARALARSGVAVALIARDADALASQAEAITSTAGTALPIAADCTDWEQLQHAAQRVLEALGPPTVLFAFAGGRGAPAGVLAEDIARWHAVLDANLTATFLTIKAFLPTLVEQPRSSVVTMSSSAAVRPERASAAYTAAKAGIIAFTRQLANDLAPRQVRVNCLAPASTLNERMRRHMNDGQLAQLAATFPLGRIGVPQDIADAALFLASDASSWITGITLDVAGGRVMR